MSSSKFRTVVITVSGNRTVLRIFYYPRYPSSAIPGT